MADPVLIEISAKIDQLLDATSKSKSAIESIGGSVSKLGSGFTSLTGIMQSMAALAAGGLFKEMVDSANNATAEVNKLTKQFGITLEAASTLRAGLMGVGVSTEDYTNTALKMVRMVKTQEEEMNRAGMATRSANGAILDQKTLVDNALTTLMSYKEGVDRNIVAFSLFGRSAADATQMLRANAEAMERGKVNARELGLTISQDNVSAMIAYKKAMAELEMVFEAVRKIITDAILPSLTQFAQYVRSNAPGALDVLRMAVKELGNVFGTLIDTARDLIGVIKEIDSAFGGSSIQTFKDAFRDLNIYLANASANLGIVAAYAKYPFDSIKRESEIAAVVARRALKDIEHGIQDLADQAGLKNIGKAVFAEMLETLAKLNKEITDAGAKSADALTEMGRKRREIAMASLDTEKQANQLSYADLQARLQQGVNTYRITETQKFLALKDANEAKYQDDVALLQKQAAIASGDVVRFAAIQNQIKLLKMQHENEMQQLTFQSINAQTQRFMQYFEAIQSAWDSQWRGILTGTTTFTQAAKNALLDLTIKAIGFFEKMALEWVAQQLGMTTATSAAAASRASIEAAAAATGAAATLPIRAGKFMSDITADAAAVFGGVFANLAPLMGPAAAGPATAASSTVLAGLAAVPKFDVGTPYVPQDMLAIVHKGERITPAAQNVPGAGGGGINFGDVNVYSSGGKVSPEQAMTALAGAARNMSRGMKPKWMGGTG